VENRRSRVNLDALAKLQRVVRGLRGPHAHSVYVLDRSATVGRAPAADIQVLDQRVSRQHARFLFDERTTTLLDLSSHNGTFVNGHKIAKRALRHGDRLQIGVAEYIYEEIRKGELRTSGAFLSKLTTRETFGQTVVKKLGAPSITTSPTAEIPEAELDAMTAAARAEKRTASDADTGEFDPPSQIDRRPLSQRRGSGFRPQVDESYPEFGAASQPAVERSATARPVIAMDTEPIDYKKNLPFAPRDPSLLTDTKIRGYATEPLDPRRHAPEPTPKRRTLEDVEAVRDDQPPPPPPEPIPPASGDIEIEPDLEAQQAVDAVLRLLALRAREATGAALKVHEREGLRKLEAALRSRRRGDNRRRWSRLPCKLSAQVGAATSAATVIDISAGGISVEGSTLPIAPGDGITVRVQLGSDRLARTAVFKTKVVWVDALEGSFGAVFDGPASWEMTAS
jgi:hypothetical protein